MELERMKQETKLVALEFMSNSSADLGRERNRCGRTSLPERTTKESIDNEIKYRRCSENNELKIKRKLSKILDPLNRKISKDVLSSIAKFDRSVLKETKRDYFRRDKGISNVYRSVTEEITTFDTSRLRRLSCDSYVVERNRRICRGINNFDRNGLRAVRKQSVKGKCNGSLSLLSFSASDTCIPCPDTPLTCATMRLEEISQCIMRDCPFLLDASINRLLCPIEENKEMSYKHFSLVAKPIFENQLTNLTQSVWSKVALIFYLVKEVLFSGALSGIQVELLVDYATQFVAESSFDEINKEGGWVALECESKDLLESNGFMWDYNGHQNELHQIAIASEYRHAVILNEIIFDRALTFLTHIGSVFALMTGVGFLYHKLL
ncbi:uncharacterized protein LOC135696458 [Rhopilema esculentum]|uniref:uncharacterized protein LOC135696458 n=1 Tax=Rhopilema esculentum TaxID=499914 RepID=UPI0031D7926F